MDEHRMSLDRALDIIDIETSQNALAPFTGDCILTRELMTEARRLTAANGRQVSKALRDKGFSSFDAFLEAFNQVKRERDAAVRDLDRKCPLCKHYSEHLGIHTCRKCKFGLGDPDFEDRWEWRGPQPEQVLAPADQSAGEYADNPVLAQA